jgi:outer membrane receptor protein involved in Fe transport
MIQPLTTHEKSMFYNVRRKFSCQLQTQAAVLLVVCFGFMVTANGQTVEAPKSTQTKPNDSTEADATLKPVVVRASQEPVAAGKSSLTREEFSRMPGTGGDPMRAAQSLPGVVTANDLASEPAIRGARPSNNAYYVDFLPVGYVYHLGGLTSVFHPDLVRNFDLYTAAWSPEYGDVLGGVFDISLRNPKTDRLGGSIDVGFLGANVLVEGPINKELSFFLTGRRSWLDAVIKPIERTDGTFSIPAYTDTQGRLIWQPNASNRVRFDFSTADDKFKANVRESSTTAIKDPVLAGDITAKQSYATAAVVWDADLGDGKASRFALGHINSKSNGKVASAGGYDVALGTTYLKEEIELPVGANHALKLGASLQSTDVAINLDINYSPCTEFDANCGDITSSARKKSSQNLQINTVALYANDRWQIAPNWTFTGGLRLSNDAYLKEAVAEPRLGLEWAATPTSLFSAKLGQHNQMPDGSQIIPVFGNSHLLHSRSTHAVLGLDQKFDNGWSVHTEVYAKKFDRLVVAQPDVNYLNGAHGSSRGAELLLKKQSSNGLSGFVALSYSRSDRTVDRTGKSFPFEFDQPLVATLGATYKPSEKWQLGAKWYLHSGATYTPLVGVGKYPDGRTRPIYGEINSHRYASYHRLDVRADYKYSDAFSVYGEVINAYNRKNISGYSYSADYKTRTAEYQLPVLISIGLQYKF